MKLVAQCGFTDDVIRHRCDVRSVAVTRRHCYIDSVVWATSSLSYLNSCRLLPCSGNNRFVYLDIEYGNYSWPRCYCNNQLAAVTGFSGEKDRHRSTWSCRRYIIYICISDIISFAFNITFDKLWFCACWLFFRQDLVVPDVDCLLQMLNRKNLFTTHALLVFSV